MAVGGIMTAEEGRISGGGGDGKVKQKRQIQKADKHQVWQ
jgi:hypothetical protein